MHKGSLKAVREALGSEEDVLVLDVGNADGRGKIEPGALAITDRRVIWASKALGMGGVRDFRYDRIATVETARPSLMSKGHTLKLETAGDGLTVKLLRDDYGSFIRERM
jgi:hypothetical protein